jgi:hypothetical protein
VPHLLSLSFAIIGNVMDDWKLFVANEYENGNGSNLSMILIKKLGRCRLRNLIIILKIVMVFKKTKQKFKYFQKLLLNISKVSYPQMTPYALITSFPHPHASQKTYLLFHPQNDFSRKQKRKLFHFPHTTENLKSLISLNGNNGDKS